MTKEHYITFLAAVSDQRIQLVKLYPEWGAEARFKIDGGKDLYACCNRHGLFRFQIKQRYEDPERRIPQKRGQR